MVPLTVYKNNYISVAHVSKGFANRPSPPVGIIVSWWGRKSISVGLGRFESSYLIWNWNRGLMANTLITTNHLRHVESMATMPSGAGNIPHLNSIILGEALASEENDLIFPSDDFSRQAHVPSPQKYLDMYKRSIEDPAGFWSDFASDFFWKQKWGQQVYFENLDVSKGDIRIEWFKGGLTNICYNCLDRNVEAGLGDRVALYWEGNEPSLDGTLTYLQLLQNVCQLANYLKEIGVKKGDAIVVYLPMLMELPITMLACARIGAVHSVVFAGFSAESLAQRIVDCKPKVVITCNAVKRGSKIIHLKDIVDAALNESAKIGVCVDVCLTYENESALKRQSTKWEEGRDIWWQDVIPKYPTTCAVEWVDAEDPLFLLYTSGSTGKPKGVLHTTGGYLGMTSCHHISLPFGKQFSLLNSYRYFVEFEIMDAPVVHSRAEGEVEDHHEKKSVMKKVKAKAKKLKDTIAGYSHQSHEQEGQRTPGDHDLDEEETIAGYSYQSHEREGQRTPDDHDLDEEDDEVDSPEVSAPKYDSGARRTDAPAQGDILKETVGDTKVGRDEVDPVVPRERSNVNVTDPIRSNVPGLHGTTGHGATHNSGGDRMTDAPGQGGIHSGEARHEYDPVVPRERTNGGFSGPVSELGPGQNRTSTGHEDLLGVARTKLAGPATGPLHKHEEPKELGGGTCTPLNTPVSSLPRGNDNSATMDVDPVKTSGLGQGGHLSESRLGKTDVLGEETPLPQSIPVSEEDPHAPKANPQADTPSNYETKVTDPTKSGGEETGVTPVIRSFDKMNLHGDDRQYLNDGANQNMSTGSHDQLSPDKPLNQGSSYISSATSVITNTAISAKNVVASKLGYGGTESAEHDDYHGAGKSGSSPHQHQNQVLDPATNQFKPAETPQIRGTIQPDHNTGDVKQSNQSGGTYTEKISSATSAIADKAISAKNVVASKLGFGSTDQVHDNRDVTPTNVQPGSTQADQQGKPITSAVAEKLSPVYGKVAGAGTAVMSKFQGGKTASTGRDTSTEAVSEAGQDKGVSVKDYFVEKLRPGEEDRALSEVISEKLQIHKPGVKEQGGDSATAMPMGKVTESEEVRQRLGNTEGNDNFVVNKIEETVGSMLGGTNKNGDEHQSAATGEAPEAAGSW